MFVLVLSATYWDVEVDPLTVITIKDDSKAIIEYDGHKIPLWVLHTRT